MDPYEHGAQVQMDTADCAPNLGSQESWQEACSGHIR